MLAIAACCRDISRYRFWDTFNLTSCARARLPPLVRSTSRTGNRRSSDMWARAARLIGTCACSTVCSDFDEIRVHSRRAESREAFSARLARDLGKPVKATKDWRDCVEGADIVVEASRLTEPAPMLKTAWVKQGALVVPYGTMSAVELSLTDIMDKMIVDDWGQCKTGQFGSLCGRWLA
jgi:ornithine cyclodeaminase/alanine dehydrogenase-like protein (mu-crystallin family)